MELPISLRMDARLIARIATKKARLDQLRPLPAAIVARLACKPQHSVRSGSRFHRKIEGRRGIGFSNTKQQPGAWLRRAVE